MNPIMNIFGNDAGTPILMQAIGAAMRGESPQAFMKKLANQSQYILGALGRFVTNPPVAAT